MKDITIFDNKSQTEITLVLNTNGDVIGTEIYFSIPRELSLFFNKNEAFRQSNLKLNPSKSIVRNKASMLNKGPNLPFHELQDSNIRFKTSKTTPCGGLR